MSAATVFKQKTPTHRYATTAGQSRVPLAFQLARPVAPHCLGFIRIAFGLVIVWEVWRYFTNGWIERYFREPTFFFTYWPFDFVRPWPGIGMDVHFFALGLAGLLVAAGLYYRVAATALFVLFGYVFLLDKANYLNHFYLVLLVSFVLIWLPAHRVWSLDGLRRPQGLEATIPMWVLWLVRFQVGLPYFLGGVAKLNVDWLAGEPLRTWLANRTDFPLIGRFFTEEPVVWSMVYGSLAFDLAVVPLLLHRRTRPFAFATAMVFHLLNAQLFDIGIFPWMMILLTTVFFPPDWPRRLVDELRSGKRIRLLLPAMLGFPLGVVAADGVWWIQGLVVAVGMAALTLDVMTPQATTTRARHFNVAHPLVLAMLGIWVTSQILIPLRHFAIPGDVHWTEEGHRFSWHMMVRSKDGTVAFNVADVSTGETWAVDAAEWLTSRQMDDLAGRPDMILQFAHYLEDVWATDGHDNVEVRAIGSVSLNGKPSQPLVDPQVDLSAIMRPWSPPASWIVPPKPN